ncbi:Gfo/Idh/MocA family protein [Phaeodactylibacter xiamenensis]|uniref:Gfo/Idh/MocA family protein n=1 Tax=Phaeodactylibacter xiamenensis TaxID=1524460 RepID=UPI003BA96C63
MKSLNIGILGTADIAKRAILPNIKDLPSYYIITAIASRTMSKAQELADVYDAKAFPSYEEMINANCCDAIYLPLPNSLHYEYVMKCLEAGIHVLVEKPLACSNREVIVICQKAKEKGIVVVENFQFRFHQQLATIQDMVTSGEIGEIRSFRSTFCFPPFPNTKTNIRYQSELGGGALLDAGAYPIKIAQMFIPQPLSVKAASLWIDPELGVDIWGGGVLESESSSHFAQIAFGFDNFYQCNIEILGSKGKLYTNRIFTAKPSYKPTVLLEKRTGQKQIELEPDNPYRNMLLYFYELVVNRDPRQLEIEYQANIMQSKLLTEFKNLANEQQ